MKRRKLGRKGIRLRNNLIIISILSVIAISIYMIINKHPKENMQIQYAKQTQQLLQASDDIQSSTEGTTYYISSQGTSTEGTDINEPMSLKTANTKTYNGNDKILFKAGDTFYGTVNFNIQASENEYTYIGSYGEGEKPIISGANILINSQAWTLEDDLYKIDLSDYSNFEGIGKTYWEPYNIGFLADEKGNIYGSRKKTKDEVINEFDFYCENNYLYIKCSKNPTEKLGKIKFAPRNNLVSLSSNTIVENLDIQYTGAHGIVKKTSEFKNVYIKNCIIQNIGGSVQIANSFTRYGNGLEFWNSANNTIVERCLFRNIYDAAYTMQGNTVTTGFENNICQNSIFINCTYPYETSCRNKDDSTLKIYMSGQKFINNISINQGRGWGYDVRPDKDPAAEFVLWSMPTSNTDIEISGNKQINSRRIKYKSVYTEIPVDDYKKCIKSDNNYIYMAEDTLLMNNAGNYQDRSVLQDYNLDQNSTFRLLTPQDLTQINNQAILASNNYDEIKTYYENLEKNFQYEDAIAPIQEKYTQFKTQNQSIINQIQGLSAQIDKQETYLKQINAENITEQELINHIRETYQIGSNILDAYINNELDITENELIIIMQQIDAICKSYNDLYNLLQPKQTADLTEAQNKITNMENEITKYEIVGLGQITNIIDNCTETMESNIHDVIKNISVTNMLDWADTLLDIDVINYVTENPPTIKYSTTELTNQNVTATITSNYDIQVTNNNNSKTYTFEKNDSFTFEYTVRNKPYKITAAVTNIDKIAPKITGVEEGSLYYIEQQIVPKITDINLKDVTLYVNGVQIEYKIGEPLIVEGIYKLVATDEAGNVTTVQFQVMEKPSEKYIMQESSIQNIKYNTTKTKFDAKVKIQETYTIERETENETIQLESTDTIASGDILTTASGQKYTLIVSGDLTKDGVVDIQDFVRMRRYLLGLRELDEVETLAADANVDSKDLSISDYIRIRILILNQMAGV